MISNTQYNDLIAALGHDPVIGVISAVKDSFEGN